MASALFNLLDHGEELFSDDSDPWGRCRTVMDIYTEKTYKKLINEIKRLSKNKYYGLSEYSARILNPTLLAKKLINGFVDFGVDTPNSIVLKHDMLNVCKNLYSYNDEEALSILEDHEYDFKYLPFPFLNCRAITKSDGISWRYTNPTRLEDTVISIFDAVKEDGLDLPSVLDKYSGVFFVHTATGSILPGLNVENIVREYLEESGFEIPVDSYAVRLSVHKMKDDFPKFSDEEKLYLQEQGKNKLVILFDEDVFSGLSVQRICKGYYDVFDNRDSVFFSAVGWNYPSIMKTGYTDKIENLVNIPIIDVNSHPVDDYV